MTPPLDRESRRRLRVSPNFVLAFAMDGRAYVAKDTEPYVQYWLSEQDRVLHSIFASRRGATTHEACEAYFRITRRRHTPAASARLGRAVRQMRSAGVVTPLGGETSRYDRRIVRDYVTHRPFPSEIARHIVKTGSVRAATRVLDVAGGPGDLALALARRSRDVSVMDLSKAFLKAARARANAEGLPLATIHESGNQLVFRDDDFDVITISQALHWLDDVMVAKGVCRLLRPGGSFFVVHAAIDVLDTHPLANVLGRRSMFGHSTAQSFADEVTPLLDRLTLLFEALDTPGVHRNEASRRHATGRAPGRMRPLDVSIFEQRRPFDVGYVRGFLTDAHIAAIGRSPNEFWKGIETQGAGAPADAWLGTQHWAVLRFGRVDRPCPRPSPGAPISIGFERGHLPLPGKD